MSVIIRTPADISTDTTSIKKLPRSVATDILEYPDEGGPDTAGGDVGFGVGELVGVGVGVGVAVGVGVKVGVGVNVGVSSCCSDSLISVSFCSLAAVMTLSTFSLMT